MNLTWPNIITVFILGHRAANTAIAEIKKFVKIEI
jgi:hypothetical protein